MLLPKRFKKHHTYLLKTSALEKNQKNLSDAIFRLASLLNYKIVDGYLLDHHNVMIVINSDEPVGYIMIHERLNHGKLEEINRWPMDNYVFGLHFDDIVMQKNHLFQVQDGYGNFGAFYDYQAGKFVETDNDLRELDLECPKQKRKVL